MIWGFYHKCPFNETKIDDVVINKRDFSHDSYSIWLEKDDGIVIEKHKWVNGNYKAEHQNFCLEAHECDG